MHDKFLVYEQQPAMALDSLKSTHPISSAVHNPSQISETFDAISYSKGKLYCHAPFVREYRADWGNHKAETRV
jgi:aminopeptidase N